jgi:hypothetical protein
METLGIILGQGFVTDGFSWTIFPAGDGNQEKFRINKKPAHKITLCAGIIFYPYSFFWFKAL